MLRTLAALTLTSIVVVSTCSPVSAADTSKRPTYTEDVVAIQQLIARYAHALDAGNGKEWAATFTEDGVFKFVDSNRVVAGREQIAALVRPGRKPYESRHNLQSPWIEVNGDTATLKAYLIVTRGTEVIVTGSYDDTLRRVNGQWLFSERRFTNDKPAEPAKQ